MATKKAAQSKATRKKATTNKAGNMSGTARPTKALRNSRKKKAEASDPDETPTLLARETRGLSVIISDEEWRAASEALGASHAERSAQLDHAKELKDSLKAQLEEIEARMNRLSGLVHNRKETRQVECELRAYHDKGEAVLVRTDTGEVISRRSLTHEERQKPLIADDPDPSQADEARKRIAGGHVDAFQRGKAELKAHEAAVPMGKPPVNSYTGDGYGSQLDRERWLSGFHGDSDPLDGWVAPLELMATAWDHARQGRDLKAALRAVPDVEVESLHHVADQAAVEAAYGEGVDARGRTSTNPYKIDTE